MNISPNLFESHPPVKPRDHDGKFAPVIAKHDPQTQVRRHLLLGMKITVGQCWRLYHSSELRRIISRLRSEGMDIRDKWHGKHKYKIYFYVPPKQNP